MLGVQDTVNDRIAHVHIRAGHVDFSPEYFDALVKFAGLHFFKKLKVFGYRAVAEGAFLTRLFECAAVFTNLVCV